MNQVDISIETHGLGKRYNLGVGAGYRSLREAVVAATKRPFRRGPVMAGQGDFWALRNVDLTVAKGEVIGVIGRNGSGKSTLLKLLSRITEPSEGWAEVHGRVASLLEVGTGFHPELTGRENTYLNGAILGMSRSEIDSQFDNIVDFSGVAEFLDTPVKRYSSGMAVRLAFAVAAHLQPEVLIVDEVLAVGDIEFQRKCLGKMGDVASSGRTVIVVSHQMNQIQRLCDRVVWLDGGVVRMIGATQATVAEYQAASLTKGSRARGKVGETRFVSWSLEGPEDGITLDSAGPFEVSFDIVVSRHVQNAAAGIALLRDGGLNVWANAVTGLDLQPGTYRLKHRIGGLPLQPGAYQWEVSLSDLTGMLDLWSCEPGLLVTVPPVTHFRDEYAGVLNVPSSLTICEVPDDTKPEMR